MSVLQGFRYFVTSQVFVLGERLQTCSTRRFRTSLLMLLALFCCFTVAIACAALELLSPHTAA